MDLEGAPLTKEQLLESLKLLHETIKTARELAAELDAIERLSRTKVRE